MNNRLYVGNLSYDTNEAKLRELFSQAGPIRSVSIPMDRMTNQPRALPSWRWRRRPTRSRPSSCATGRKWMAVRSR